MSTLTRTIRGEVRFADLRKADRAGKNGLPYRLAATAGALMEGSNRVSFALASTFLGATPWLTEPDPKDPDGPPRRVHARSLAYAGLSGKWQPYGAPLYAPKAHLRVSGAVLAVQAGEILARLTGSKNGVSPKKAPEDIEGTPPDAPPEQFAVSAKVHWHETASGRRSFPGFNLRRRGIPLRNDSVTLGAPDGDGRITLTIWSAQSPKGNRTVTVRPWIRRDGSVRATLRRLREGNLKLGGSALTYDPDKRMGFLSLAWTDEAVVELAPTVPLIGGVDVNMIKSAVVAYVHREPPRCAERKGKTTPFATLAEAVGVEADPPGFLPEGCLRDPKSPRRKRAEAWLGIERAIDRFDLGDHVLRAWDRIDNEKRGRLATNREE